MNFPLSYPKIDNKIMYSMIPRLTLILYSAPTNLVCHLNNTVLSKMLTPISAMTKVESGKVSVSVSVCQQALNTINIHNFPLHRETSTNLNTALLQTMYHRYEHIFCFFQINTHTHTHTHTHNTNNRDD